MPLFDAPLADDALLAFVVRARRLARIAQRDEPGVYQRRVLEPAHYVDWDRGRAAAPAEGRVSALRDRVGLFGVAQPRRRASFKTSAKLALPPSKAPAAADEPAKGPEVGGKPPASPAAEPGSIARAAHIDARGLGGGNMPDAHSQVASGNTAAVTAGQVWVVSKPGFFAEMGEPIVLYRHCVTAGDRGLWIPD